MRLEPSSAYTHAELAALFTAAYEGYYMPFAVDEPTFRFMATTWDLDLDASRVAVDEGRRVGLVNLGVRGREGWIGGVGVVADRRGDGIGALLMRAATDEARSRGIARLWLEVLEQNEPAIRLYEKLGYERTRELEVWSLAELVFQKHKVSSVSSAAAAARIAAERERGEPWQRADETVAHLDEVEGLEHERGALLFRRQGDRAHLLQAVAADVDAARELLESLPATSLQWLNGPAGDPFSTAIASLGGMCAARQHEMLLQL